MRRTEKPQANWERMNLLENLLVGGLLPSLSVPRESGVSFYIRPDIDEDGLCLLFNLDWGGRAPLFSDDVYKPDFLVLFSPNARRRAAIASEARRGGAPPVGWIATLIEMKGQERKSRRHAVEQLTAGHARLRQAFGEHLPGSLRVHWQGLLLTPPNGDLPLQDIEAARRAGLPIVAVQSLARADLTSHVRTLISPETRVPPSPTSRTYAGGVSLRTRLAEARRVPTEGKGDRVGLRVRLELEEASLELRASQRTAALSTDHVGLRMLLRRQLLDARGPRRARPQAAAPHPPCGPWKLKPDP